MPKQASPPEMSIDFFGEQKNLDRISCYSNEGDGWNKTNIKLESNKLNIFFSEKFKDRRGRINCSLKDIEGWRSRTQALKIISTKKWQNLLKKLMKSRKKI